MPLFGAHVSVAGGISNAFAEFDAIGGEALQIFAKNQRRWESPPLDPEEAEKYRLLAAARKNPPSAVHASYLLNFASADPEIVEKTIKNSADDLNRAEMLGIPFLVVHPGSHGGEGVSAGIERIALNIARAIETAGSLNVTVLLETTSGAGNAVGGEFSHLRDIIAASPRPQRLAVCLDTCHVFAAGYELRGREGYERTMEEVERVLGVSRVKLIHINDSLGALGSKRDRHEHIGKGEIGKEGFENLVTDPRWKNCPMVLETPQGIDFDRKNLAVLRKLAGRSAKRPQTKKPKAK